MRFLLCLLCCLSVFAAAAQPAFNTTYTGAAAYSALQPEPFQFFKNAASLAWHKKASAGFYGERRFNLSELFFATIAATLPVGNSRFGLGVQSLGGEAFRHSRYTLAYAHAMGTKAAVGASFGYQQLSVSGYGGAGFVDFSAGAQLRLAPQLLVGLSVNNPTGFGRKQAVENSASASIEAGAGYDVSEAFLLSAIIVKKAGAPPGVQAACQYRFDKKLISRIGLETATGQFFVGAGFLWRTFRIDAVGTVHPRLGFTPSLQLIYQPKPAE